MSSYFEVRGRLRLDDTLIEEVSLIERSSGGSDGVQLTPVWRERRAAQTRQTGSLQ
jgi:hypothetical protein